jgi:hypothetical protein
MTNLIDGPPNDGEPPPAQRPPDDDASDVTQNNKRRAKEPVDQLVEKTVKFRFPQTSATGHSVDPALFHLHWMQMVQEAFGTSIEIFNNNGGKMPSIDLMRWKAEHHQKQFKILSTGNNEQRDYRQKFKNDDRDQSKYIIHRIRTSLTMTAMKQVQRISNLLEENGVFMSEHRWPEDIWQLKRLGFMLGLDPQVYTPQQAYESLLQDLRKKVPQTTKIPKFAVVFCSPKVTWKNQFRKTKAYCIEVEKTNAMELVKILKSAYKDSREFVPFQMRDKSPEAYANNIDRQTQMMADTRVITLNYFGPDIMFYLTEHIMAINGITAIIPARTIDIDGKYRLPVHKNDFHAIRRTLQTNLNNWCDTYVQCDLERASRKFSGHSPEVAHINADDYSSGEDTYMTDSINTALSYDSVSSDLTNNDSHASESNYPKAPSTWASRIRANLQVPTQFKQHPLPPSTATTVPIQDDLISDLASSKAEVDELKRKILIMEAEKETEKLEKAQQQKEMQFQAAKQKFDYERRMMEQKKELDERLAEQKKQIEEKAAQDRIDMEESLAQRIAQAIQANDRAHPPAPPPPSITTPQIDLTTVLQNYDHQIKVLTELIRTIATSNTSSSEERNATKRSAPMEIIDLSVDHDDINHLKHSGDLHMDRAQSKAPAERKRQDTRATPQKLPPPARNPLVPTTTLYTPADNPMSPASDISCSIAYTPDRRHPSTWESHQRTPETKSTV